MYWCIGVDDVYFVVGCCWVGVVFVVGFVVVGGDWGCVVVFLVVFEDVCYGLEYFVVVERFGDVVYCVYFY